MMDVETIAYQPPALATYSRGLKIQANVIGALLMRELHTRYGRDNVGYLWMFGEPMILATAVASLHAAQKSHDGSDMAMIPFAIAGYTLFIMFRGMINRAEGTLEANMPLLYHRSVSIFDMMFARAVLEGISTFATFLILICGAYALGLADLPARPFDLLLGAFLMFWWSAAISFIICAVTHDNMLVGRLVHPATYILMPLCGAFYQLSWVPEPYQTWLSRFPMCQIFEEFRYGQFKSANNRFVDLYYIFGWCLLLSYVGILSMRMVRRRVHLR